MPNDQHTNLARTIVTLYRNHCGLFWRIMMPVAVIAIMLDVAMFFYVVTGLEKDIKDRGDQNVEAVTTNVNTINGIHPTITSGVANTREWSGMSWQFYLIPNFHSNDGKGRIWKWELDFLGLNYSLPIMFLLLTFCPLSLAVARISAVSQISNTTEDLSTPTAHEIWRDTGRKAFTIFAALLIFILLIDVVANLYGLVLVLVPSLVRILPFGVTSFLFTVTGVSHIYLLVTLSLYNPCLILENNSIMGIFRRSHALVSGARLRFFGIYFLTCWIASILTSVLLGVTLLVFSLFVSDLAQVRDALSPLKFLSLFIGGDIEVVLPELLNVPATVAILIVKGLIATFLVPIWAILTTLLYLEQVDVKPNALKEAV
ncbi:hypothetical protein F4X88_10870 [Candidatus Poribacteria bacterium]|nr:hypothetical protein [Candidatus Poribacteria bacterium]MYA56789.1 hypothetical protein [Candidatus Poribacteria bacterium]